MPPTVATDLTGRRFGKLTVVERAPAPKDSRRAFWHCSCDCGQQTVKMGKYLLCGDTRSCGCDQRAHRESGNVRHGGFLHGVRQREYTIWRSIKSRCYTKSSSNYRFYGGRGITMCDRWRDDYLAFLADMGPCPDGHSIDRIDPTGDYEPSNCRWATAETQHNNTTLSVYRVFNGERLTLAQIARRTGVNYYTLHNRVTALGQDVHEAVNQLTQHS